jgi:pimeloyl-ACP methyl ester carboxylesterase
VDQFTGIRSKGAQLVLYPDAGHGFLFQDTTTFVKRVDTFLG